MSFGDVIARALRETMPRGDLTVRNLKFANLDGAAKISAAEDFVLAGHSAFEQAVTACATDAEFGWQFREGDLILAGQTVAWIKASPGALFCAEDLSLFLLGRASGIATFTRCFVFETRGTSARITNARQTTPGLGALELHAVAVGGATISEGDRSTVLRVTSGQARAAGSLARALAYIRESHRGPFEVECSSLGDVELAVTEHPARVIITDDTDFTAARRLVPPGISLEVGGVIPPPRVRELALAGADFVRVDQLLTSAPSAQLRLIPAPG